MNVFSRRVLLHRFRYNTPFPKKIKLFFITLDEKEPIQYLLCKDYVGYFLPINENSSILK